MTVDPGAPTFLFESDMEVARVQPFAGGSAALFSRRSPVKETPNEDAVALIPIGPHAGVLAVADGVGGLAGGEQAARAALVELAQALAGPAEPGVELRTRILDGIERANAKVRTLAGAGTTLAVAEIVGSSVRTYHVGDSMILLTGQRGRLKLQTIPHSPVGYAVESGLLDEWEAMVHEDRHLIDNMVGTEHMRIEIGPARPMARHDTLVLASDGLSDNLHPEEIVEAIRKGTMEDVAVALGTACRQRMDETIEGRPGKPDDLSFIVFRG